jgi:hypothetical protein
VTFAQVHEATQYFLLGWTRLDWNRKHSFLWSIRELGRTSVNWVEPDWYLLREQGRVCHHRAHKYWWLSDSRPYACQTTRRRSQPNDSYSRSNSTLDFVRFWEHSARNLKHSGIGSL